MRHFKDGARLSLGGSHVSGREPGQIAQGVTGSAALTIRALGGSVYFHVV